MLRSLRGPVVRAVARRPFTAQAAEPALRVSQRNQLMVIELNRPKMLNALNMDMCAEIKTHLLDAACASTTAAVLIKGNGGRAFCAGGDVKATYQELCNAGHATGMPLSLVGSGKAGFIHSDVFRHAYSMTYMTATSSKPQVSIWDGIVMGAGVGLSVFSDFKVVTDKSTLAMPETAIGLFPDVGASFWLPKLPCGLGLYTGLTGARLGPAELLHTGTASHYLRSDQLDAMEQALAGLRYSDAAARKQIQAVLDDFQSQCTLPRDSFLLANQHTIQYVPCLPPVPCAPLSLVLTVGDRKCFGDSVQSLEQVMALLQEDGSEFALKTIEVRPPVAACLGS